MPGRALSERVKKQACCRAENARYQSAIDEYNIEQMCTLGPGEKKCGYRTIADKWNVDKSVLQRLVQGGTSLSAFNVSKRKLTYAEEHILVDFILESADRGLPLYLTSIERHANGVLEGRDKPGEPVEKNWVGRFMDRYRDELQTHWSRPLAMERAKSLNKAAVQGWFELIKKEVIDKGVKERNIYGMDESGFPPSHQGVKRVVGRRGTKVQHKIGSANRENVTVLVTICADGTALKPTIIFKGQRFQQRWAENNISGAS